MFATRTALAVVLGALELLGCTQRSSTAQTPATPVQPELPAQPEPPEPPEPPVQPEPPPAQPEPPAPPEPPVQPEANADVPPPGFTPLPAKRRKGFPGIAFAKVRAFAFDLRVSKRPVCARPLDPDGTPCETVERPGVELSPEQTQALLSMLSRRGTWGSGSACFLPHHGFVFYDDADVPVAEISVCFMCNMLVAAPAIPAAKTLGEGGGFGLSEKGASALRALCHDLGLPKCDAKHPSEFGRGPR